MRYKITLSYDGTNYCGWQSQPNGKSIQDALERAANSLFGTPVRVTGSGRTDAGVHALGQVAHFDCDKELPLKNVVSGLNAYLPRDIRVLDAQTADGLFDARKSVKRKTYMYVMYTGERLPVFNDRAACVGEELDISAMNAQAQKLVGTHDFATFMAANGGAKTSIRTVYDAHIERDGRMIKFFITANGFLYNMVRIIVAQLIKAGRGEPVDMAELIEKRDRALAKEIAEACGLYMYKVDYDGAEAHE